MFCGENPGFSFNLNQEDDEESLHEQDRDNGKFQEQLVEEEADKEPMFEKPLTPSDVGKLNRLVIPKQHAEKYFPLSGNGGGDSGGGGGEKGLLLSFEDESGKCWRFRYSYWNSSQSYVLTKGWSRFVKEKQLDAGDVVLFERHRVNGDRLFIGWRRRSTPNAASTAVAVAATGQNNRLVQTVAATGGGGGWTQVFYSYPTTTTTTHGPLPPPIPYQPDHHCLHSVVQNQTTTTPSGNSKRLRLFGVNLECQPDESEPSTPDGSSQGQAYYHQYCTINPHDHASTNQQTSHDMDINFSRNVNRMRYHQG